MTYLSPIEAPRFKWKCSYQGSVWYEVWDHTGIYEIELRRSADDYERKFYNGDDADWQRNVVAMIGVLRRASGGIDQEVPAQTLRAFNEWLTSEHEKHIAEMKAQPNRYGTDFSDIMPPTLAKAAAVYRDGWHVTAAMAQNGSVVCLPCRPNL